MEHLDRGCFCRAPIQASLIPHHHGVRHRTCSKSQFPAHATEDDPEPKGDDFSSFSSTLQCQQCSGTKSISISCLKAEKQCVQVVSDGSHASTPMLDAVMSPPARVKEDRHPPGGSGLKRAPPCERGTGEHSQAATGASGEHSVLVLTGEAGMLISTCSSMQLEGGCPFPNHGPCLPVLFKGKGAQLSTAA